MTIFGAILYIALILIFVGRGVEQGILWSRKGVDAFDWNEHYPIAFVRIMIGIVVVLSGLAGEKAAVLSLVAFLPSFWFWHNTAYYYIRNKINPKVYVDWFKARSTTSSAEVIKAMKWQYRLALLILSLTLLILTNLL